MKLGLLSNKVFAVVIAATLIWAPTLTANAITDHKRTAAGGNVSVDIENFGKINDHFYRGGQPKGRDYQQLFSLGIKTVVDLREDARDDSRSSAERAGLRYINLPMKEKSYPQADTAERFLQIVNDQANWPVFIHCAGGKHRTGVMTAVYRISVDGWNIDQAYQEMKQYDFSTSFGHGCYKDYIFDYFRNQQTQAMKQRIAPSRSGN